MIKLLSLLNITGLLLFKAFFLTDVVVTQEVPATMQAGAEVRVSVMIDKDQLNGFAKLQIDLPEGLSATAIETKGASFTFADGQAKFIWMALPNAPRFQVTYTLAAADNATGSLPITGKFSYIEDNERKTKDMPVSTVTITGTAVAQDMSAPTEPAASTSEPVPTSSEPAVTAQEPAPVSNSNDLVFAGGGAPAKEIEVVNTSGIAPQQGAGSVTTKRVITPVTENELLVEVTVSKGDIRGFGKLQETIPAGFSALEKASEEAIFTAQDRVVKFVWLNLPAKKDLKVVYKLRSNGQPEGEYTVNGEFGYLLNDETQKAVTGSTNFFTGAKALEQLAAVQNGGTQNTGTTTAQNTTTPPSNNTANTNTAVQNNTAQNSTGKADPSEATASAKPKDKPSITPRIQGAETGITYKVQISAAHREVGSSYFAERHHYTGEFSIEHHEGWIKYVTGRHPDYRSARDQRQTYVDGGNNFPGPFVTAYNNGDRITVQEALMISNQRWVQ